LVILFDAPTQARASEKEIKRSEIPPAVLQAVQKKYGNARMVSFAKENEEGKTSYEVTVHDGARKSDVLLAPDGKILIEEHRITMSELPKAVKDAFASSGFARAKVRRVELVIREEKVDDPAYELVVELGGEATEIVFDQTGKLTKQSPAKKGEKE
jgi:Putative beta-lactamase-inhibitor-like, PepSY-like